jgi:hypothetical protein
VLDSKVENLPRSDGRSFLLGKRLEAAQILWKKDNMAEDPTFFSKASVPVVGKVVETVLICQQELRSSVYLNGRHYISKVQSQKESRLPFLLAAPPAIEGRGYFYPGLDGGLSQQVFEVRKLVTVPELRGEHADMQVSVAMQNKTLERDSKGVWK